MGKCVSVMVNKKRKADVLSHVYGFSQSGFLTAAVRKPGQISLELVRKHVKNSVTYVFIKPEFHLQGIKSVVAELLDGLLLSLGVKRIELMTTREVRELRAKEGQNFIIFHLAESLDDLAKGETHLFDVFFLLEEVAESRVPKGYLLESFGRFSVLNKDLQSQVQEEESFERRELAKPEKCAESL